MSLASLATRTMLKDGSNDPAQANRSCVNLDALLKILKRAWESRSGRVWFAHTTAASKVMSTLEEMNEATEAASTELELSADDLRALSTDSRAQPETGAAAESSNSALAQWLQNAESRGARRPAPGTEAARATRRGDTSQRVLISIGVAVVAIVAGVFLYANGRSNDRATAATLTTPQRWMSESAPDIDLAGENEPVRFANPFDASEVFEFPPGTSESEARDAVSRILLQRARERQT